MCFCVHISNVHMFWCLPVGQPLTRSLFLLDNHQLARGSRCCRRLLGKNKTIATCFLVVINDEINQNAEMSISNDEFKVSVCKNKNILHIYNSGAS